MARACCQRTITPRTSADHDVDEHVVASTSTLSTQAPCLARMLGFRGHVSTKSRCYSTTLGVLRQVRADYATPNNAKNSACPTPTRTPPCSSWPTGTSPGRATQPVNPSSPPRSPKSSSSTAKPQVRHWPWKVTDGE
ncbi:replication initiator [Streptomyces mirabilis]|uniref:replication initiator n=1 Tax=Streptomyces mirabilis TaxID=68239 RepID=UPI003696AD7F